MLREKHFITVGEPWDFTSPDGENIINGVILRIISDSYIVFRANYTLELQGILGNTLILYPRHSKSDFSDLKNGENCVINGDILIEEYDENMNEDSLKEKSKFVLIGSLRCG